MTKNGNGNNGNGYGGGRRAIAELEQYMLYHRELADGAERILADWRAKDQASNAPILAAAIGIERARMGRKRKDDPSPSKSQLKKEKARAFLTQFPTDKPGPL